MSFSANRESSRIHSAYLRTLLDELASRGITPEVLWPGGLPDTVSPRDLATLLQRAAAFTGDPALGLRFGLRLNLASHGMLGYALMSAGNGRQLVSLLTRYAALSIPDVTLTRVLRGELLCLTCRPAPDLKERNLFVELVLATLVAAGRSLFPRPIPGAEVWLDYPAPAHADEFRRLRLPVRFNQPWAALVCERRFLDMDIDSADPALAELCARQCEALLGTTRRRSGMADAVRKNLLGTPNGLPSLPVVAARLGTSERTLRRRLTREGTSYRAISDEVRQVLAGQYLQTTTLPVTEIAGLLGYEDPANFRRAFRRWTGTSPAAYRRRGGPRLQGRGDTPILTP